MTVPFIPMGGRLIDHADRSLLICDESQAVILRFAVLEIDGETALFPDVILDDWGNEVIGLGMYEWLENHGDQFPRAELFGWQANGAQVQRFVRELDLIGGYACYAYASEHVPLNQGREISDVIINSESAEIPTMSDPPITADFLLTRAAVRWWRANEADQDQIKAILKRG